MTESSETSVKRGVLQLREDRLLDAITHAQSAFITCEDPRTLFDHLLSSVLDVTASEYGFIGEILHTADDRPYLKAHAITNIAWNDETLSFYEQNAPNGLEFHNLKTLFGAAITSGSPVISNDPYTDARRGGLPDGHPALNAFLGIPFRAGDALIGMVGIANRPGGYGKAVLDYLEPLLATCANLIMAYRTDAERKASEAALRDSEERIRSILNSAVDAIITIDEAGAIQGCNPATEQLFGFAGDELAGKNVSMLMPSPEREMHDDYITAYLKTGQRKVIGIGRDVLGQRKDGSTFPLHLTISEAKVGEARLFTGILRDITDLLAAQAELKSTLALVRKSRDDLRAVLDQLRIWSVVLDPAGRVNYLSAACRTGLGAIPDDYGDTHWETLLPFDKNLKQQVTNLIGMASVDRKKVTAHVDTPKGQRLWMDFEVHDDPRDNSGKILFMYDITEVHDLRLQLEEHATYHDMVGKSKPMQQVFQSIADLSNVDVTVLIEGETGTGKEMVAQAIHAASARSGEPFVAVNCAGLTDPLLSSQLFGHRRGAFTGAVKDQAGIFEKANGGTVFLDEIGDISPDVQKALLRVLQEREITPLGEARARKIDVRIVTATHRNLKAEVDAGRFRMDLLYRIRVAPIKLPPLRERRTDIPLLATKFLGVACAEMDRRVESISVDALAALVSHLWPGNVRELKNAIEFAVVRCKTKKLLLRDLPEEVTADSVEEEPGSDPVDAERRRIQAALEAARGNRAAAARSLGVSRATFYRRLAELGMAEKRRK